MLVTFESIVTKITINSELKIPEIAEFLELFHRFQLAFFFNSSGFEIFPNLSWAQKLIYFLSKSSLQFFSLFRMFQFLICGELFPVL